MQTKFSKVLELSIEYSPRLMVSVSVIIHLFRLQDSLSYCNISTINLIISNFSYL